MREGSKASVVADEPLERGQAAGESKMESLARAGRAGLADELQGATAEPPLTAETEQSRELAGAWGALWGETLYVSGDKATRGGVVREILDRKGQWSALDDLDLNGDRAERLGDAAIEAGLLQKRETADLRLGEPVNRAEAVTIVSRAFGLPTLPAAQTRRVFPDLPVSHWAAEAVYGAVSAGAVTGVDGRFDPGGQLLDAHLDAFLDKAVNPPGPGAAVFDPTVEGMQRAELYGSASTATSAGAPNSFDRAGLIADGSIMDRGAARTDDERVAAANSVVDHLGAGEEDHGRYRPLKDAAGNIEATYCNVYAHDYAFLMGAYVPRVWWRGQALDDAQAGNPVEAAYDDTVGEMTANMLEDWFRAYGAQFGWGYVGDPQDPQALTTAQTEANKGRVVILVGDRDSEASGHITAIVPETSGTPAERDAQGLVVLPVQSESGGDPRTRTNTSRWFEERWKYPGELSIWVHG